MSNTDWWAKKLGQQVTPPAGRPDPTPAMPASQQPMGQMPSFQPGANPSEKAQSAKQTAACPDCGSSNYMAIQNAAARCYDCGYPIQQSGSRYGNLAGAHVEGAAKQASGNDSTSNWNPQGIIGRIDG
jgi:ribosomal protein S27AE